MVKFFSDPNRKPKVPVPEGYYLDYNKETGHWGFLPIPSFKKKIERGVTVTGTTLVEHQLDGKSNRKITEAKRRKDDRFYSTMESISEEMYHYREFFKGKTVYCPVDKVFEKGHSKFVHYFINLFGTLGLKRLVYTQYNPHGQGKMLEFSQENIQDVGIDIDGYIDRNSVRMRGGGSFDSTECVEIMKRCDIVVTNPCGSEFLDFIHQLDSLGKKFIITGSELQIPNKLLFQLVKEGRVWLGFSKPNEFEIPMENLKKDKKGQRVIDGHAYQKLGEKCWFTNIEHEKRMENLPLVETYDPSTYPRYDHYDAIHVERVDMIPADYGGVMGVPVSFLEKYNPTQFSIIDAREVALDSGMNDRTIKDTYPGRDNQCFRRICIQKIQ